MFAGVCKKSKRLFPTGIYSTFKPNVFVFVFFNELIQNIFRQGVVGVVKACVQETEEAPSGGWKKGGR